MLTNIVDIYFENNSGFEILLFTDAVQLEVISI